MGIEPSVILYIYCMVDKGKSSLLQNIIEEIRRGLIKGGALIKGGGRGLSLQPYFHKGRAWQDLNF